MTSIIAKSNTEEEMMEYIRTLESKLAKSKEQNRLKQEKYVASHRETYREYQRVKQKEYYDKKKAMKQQLKDLPILIPECLGEIEEN